MGERCDKPLIGGACVLDLDHQGRCRAAPKAPASAASDPGSVPQEGDGLPGNEEPDFHEVERTFMGTLDDPPPYRETHEPEPVGEGGLPGWRERLRRVVAGMDADFTAAMFQSAVHAVYGDNDARIVVADLCAALAASQGVREEAQRIKDALRADGAGGALVEAHRIAAETAGPSGLVLLAHDWWHGSVDGEPCQWVPAESCPRYRQIADAFGPLAAPQGGSGPDADRVRYAREHGQRALDAASRAEPPQGKFAAVDVEALRVLLALAAAPAGPGGGLTREALRAKIASVMAGYPLSGYTSMPDLLADRLAPLLTGGGRDG